MNIANWIWKNRWRRILTILFVPFMIWYLFCLPSPLFDDPTSMVLEANDGRLLGARIARDGQWRFPEMDSIPEKFELAIIQFEDKRFYRHWGVDLRALARAFRQNIRAKSVISGGSTLSMQVIRLYSKPPNRRLWRKGIEIIRATRLELRYSKKEILNLYASHAPFGGNVVGLEAASWRYFGKSPQLLSWAEAATMAVLPNSPGLIHPGRNRDALLAKRNRLLDRMYENGVIDQLDCALAKEEPLPQEPLPLPNFAPHLLDRVRADYHQKDNGKKSRFQSSLDLNLQIRVNEVVDRHLLQLKNNDINNIAVLIRDVESGKAVAYAGNALGTGFSHGESVDIIPAPRSTGSILKPILFALALQEGTITDQTLIDDIPSYINGYRPENFYANFGGAVPADRALIRSLNIPFVHLLQEYGLEKFHFGLQKSGIRGLRKDPNQYGLTLILGGAEASLEDITTVYAGMSRTLNHFHPQSGRYRKEEYHPLLLQNEDQITIRHSDLKESELLSAGAIWLTFEAMRELERPNSEGDWRRFSSSQTIAWKTGTSIGFRDAWAVGVTPDYVVGVWAGNADGEGRPGLVGVKAAGPVLFDVFEQLPSTDWFEPPLDELRDKTICQTSGFRPGPYCPIDTIKTIEASSRVGLCPFHKRIHLDHQTGLQVNSSCAESGSWVDRSWFVLPPVQEHYYRQNHPEYALLPSWSSNCDPALISDHPMQLIYPKANSRIYIPINLDGTRSATIFEAAHRNPRAKIHWHLDETYLGLTETFHQVKLDPEPGRHLLTLVDDQGFRLEQYFVIARKERE